MSSLYGPNHLLGTVGLRVDGEGAVLVWSDAECGEHLKHFAATDSPRLQINDTTGSAGCRRQIPVHGKTTELDPESARHWKKFMD